MVDGVQCIGELLMNIDLKAQGAANAVGFHAGKRTFQMGYTCPLYVPDREEAIKRAANLCDSISLACELTKVAKRFHDFQINEFTARMGFSSDGRPVICLMEGIMGVKNGNNALVGYLSLVFGYELSLNGSHKNGTNGSIAHGKP